MNADDITDLLTGHCRSRKISEIVKLTQSPAVASGENHLSVVSSVDVTAKRESGGISTFSLICKSFPKGLSCVKFLEETKAFKKEIIVYNEVLPRIAKLVGPGCTVWPACCGFRPYDTLLVEDLKAEGFCTVARREFLDLEHSKLAIRTLAMFHAWTKILIRNGELNGDAFQSYHLTDDPRAIHSSISKGVKALGRAMQQNWPGDWQEPGRALEAYAELMAERLWKLKSPENEKLIVLNHGDYWTSNLMFKHAYDSNTSQHPVDIRLLDFQMAHLNSLGWDLTYFLHGSVRPDVRRKDFTLLIQEYHRTLRTTLEDLGFVLDDIPTLSEILDDLDRLTDLKIVATCFFRVIFTSKHAYDVEAALSNTNELGLDGLDPKTLSDPDFIDHSSEDIRDLVDRWRLSSATM